MSNDRTEIEWNYSPADYFESPYQVKRSDYDILFENGTVRAALHLARDVDEALEKRIASFSSRGPESSSSAEEGRIRFFPSVSPRSLPSGCRRKPRSQILQTT